MTVQILPWEPRFREPCQALIAALPDWFGLPESNAEYLRDLTILPSWVACAGAELVGVISLEQHFPSSYEVHFLAVHPDQHRRGIGRALVAHAEQQARTGGGHWLHVKTLSPAHDDPFYARTRSFYEAVGFAPLFESDRLWGPSNPALVMLKAL
jgi:ribosomal protein S18 acetylase RimI-like enzyme